MCTEQSHLLKNYSYVATSDIFSVLKPVSEKKSQLLLLGICLLLLLPLIYRQDNRGGKPSKSPLFSHIQWCQLQKKYKPKKYNTSIYSDIETLLQPVFASYSQSKSFDQNWKAIYTKAKELAAQHDTVKDMMNLKVDLRILHGRIKTETQC
jgi:hypothetical protein